MGEGQNRRSRAVGLRRLLHFSYSVVGKTTPVLNQREAKYLKTHAIN
jgi:hypothetical protein